MNCKVEIAINMVKNSQLLTQQQVQAQVQTLSPQQVLEVLTLQLSTAELEQKVRDELYDNPALEEIPENEIPQTDAENEETDASEDTLMPDLTQGDDLSADYSSEDDMPDYLRDPRDHGAPERQMAEIPVSDSTSFYDLLLEQLGEQQLTEKQMRIGQYIIGLLRDDGLLDTDLQTISDELAINLYIDAGTDEIEEVLKVIQSMDPAGIGAQSLQECLMLQLERLEESPAVELAKRIVTQCLDDVMKKRRDRVAARLQTSDAELEEAYRLVESLDPSPGSALGEVQGHGTQYIVPDFIISMDEYGNIQFWLNNFNVPELRTNPEYEQMLREQSDSGSRSQRDAAMFLSRKIEAAKGFIQAVRQREQTLTRTMNAIIARQTRYFQTGDESLLQPMILKDVAEDTGYDISTISRATNGKYAQTDFGVVHLKDLFTDGIMAEDGQEVSVREIHRIIRELVDAENHAKPLTDDQIADALKAKGYSVARRTVAKYREQLNIPIARLRK